MNVSEQGEQRVGPTMRHPALQIPAGLPRYDIQELCWDRQHVAVFGGQLPDKALRVLIKILKPPERDDLKTQWLQRDYQIAVALRAPCAAKVFAFEQGAPAVVYVDEGARPLETLAAGALDVERTLQIGVALADATAELRKEGLVHANLNTTSVWLSPQTGAIRISDFGCARYQSIDSPARSLDQLADVRYVAPEQTGRIHQPVDQRTDIYAIGVILFRLLTGSVPFDGTDPLRIIDAHLTITPGFPAGTLPQPLIKLILKCLAKNSDRRYFSASGLKADLLEFLSQWRSKGALDEIELGRHDVRGILRIPRKLYGRERETERLKDFVTKARRSRPAVLLVKGAPGVGKSAFLNQLATLIQREKGRFVSGKFDQYKRNVPYFSLIQAFQQLVHQLLTEPAADLAVWRSRILTATEANTQVIIDVIPEVELITGAQPPVAALPPIEARNRFNRLFKNFVQTFARLDHPLCVLMDDLQWVDAASLELLQHVLTDPGTGHLLFVGAYRASEVGPAHPLVVATQVLTTASVDFQTIHLDELALADILPLIQETLSQSAKEAMPLAELLHSRSQGNPLYLTQLLNFLYDTDVIAFDYGSGAWRADLRRIQAEAVTEDILDLLAMRIRGLPAATQDVLSTAACIGSTFEAEKVAVAAARPDVDERLMACVRADLLIAADHAPGIRDDAQACEPRTFRFLHDRIQQAAFDLIPDGAKKSYRLQIGWRLLKRLSAEDRDVPQVDVLNNLNYAWELIVSKDEQRDVANLNLVAGRKARDALAYADALRYLSIGLKLLDEKEWNTCHELSFELHANAMECEYLTGAFERAERLFSLLIKNSRSKLEQAKIYLTKILLDTSEERYEEAIQIGIRALALFGIRYSRNPRMPHLVRELLLARIRMRGRLPRDLLHAPLLTDADKIAALKILVALFPTAYFLSPNLLMFSGLKVVNYSLRHGISPLSANGFVLYGLGLGAALGKYKSGYDLGQLAVELAEKGQDGTVMCKVLVIFSQFIKFWRDPIDASFPLIDRARKLALQVGDHQYVNYAIIGNLSLSLSRGTNLVELLRLCESHEAFVRQSNDAFPTESFLMWKSSVLALMGKTERNHSLSNSLYNEKSAEERYRKTGNLTLLSYQYTLRLQLAYLFGRYHDALAISQEGEAVIASAPGYITVADHYLYRGLAAVAAFAAQGSDKRGSRRTVARCLAQLKLFARNSPQNFCQHATLLEAEIAASSGDRALASKLYSQAIELAEEQGFTHLVALANERAGLYCLADEQRRLAAWYLDCARTAYAGWGAAAKVAALEGDFGTLLSTIAAVGSGPAQPPSIDDRARTEESFQVDAAAAASQVAALEDQKDRILSNLMQVIRAQTGADVAHFIACTGATPRIEASALAERENATSAGESDAARQDAFSPSIVNYVIHTRNDLVLDEPHLDPRFSRCEYLARYQPGSVMCTAIVKQSELLGVVYLEQRRIARAFDQQKLGWLRILATEVGSTVWTDKLSRYREYLHRFTPTAASKEIDADPESPDLAARELDVSVLFADLAGYTRMHELMNPQQTASLLNPALAELVVASNRIHRVLMSVHGDELFVLFQDEDSVQHVRNAAHAALAIARTAIRFNENRSEDELSITVNMGIHAGRAAVGLHTIDVATGSRWRYDATGTTVNVAARVRELARGGIILMSSVAAERIAGEFQLEDWGAQVLKNVSNPVRLYRLVGIEEAKKH